MPENSAWGTDPTLPINFSDYVGPGEMSAEQADLMAEQELPGPQPSQAMKDAMSKALEQTFSTSPPDRAVDTILDDDWLGDEMYDEDGNLMEPPAEPVQSPHSQRAMGRKVDQRGRNPRLSRAFDRRRRVVDLKIAGHTFAEIAPMLGFNSVDGVRQSFNRAQEEVRDVAEEWRDLQLARYEKITAILWPMVEMGDLEAIDKYAKIAAQVIKVTRMDQITAIGHGPGERGETARDVVERIGMVEDVNTFLSALPGMVGLSPQPAAKIIDETGKEVHQIVAETLGSAQ